MDILGFLSASFGQYSLSSLLDVMSNPLSWGVIASLVVIEGLLSADNALVLALRVRHLEPKLQKKALMYGLVGAYAFRFIALGLGTTLIRFTWIKAIGAIYLLYLAFNFFYSKYRQGGSGSHGDQDGKGSSSGFWHTVISLQVLDIAFSIDSVLAALGVSNQVWVLWVGSILGILMMRGVAQAFVKLLEKMPELEYTAYALIAFIGVKMALTIFNVHMPEWLFIAVMAIMFAATIFINKVRSAQQTDFETGE
jgi:YkoY family integral membrane protein